MKHRGKISRRQRVLRSDAENIFESLDSDDDFSDLVLASESSSSFWDNPIDDEVWNEVNETKENNGGKDANK